MAKKACKQCNRIVEDADECPVCKNNDLSESWSSLSEIYYPEDSKIAEKLEIQTPEKYAIRVK
jgi:DNA-directed RNA polymerase subunit E"